MKKTIQDQIFIFLGLILSVSGMTVISTIIENEAYLTYQVENTNNLAQGSYWYGHNLNVDTNNMFKSNPEKDISKEKEAESGSSLRSIVTSRYCPTGKLFTGHIKANPNNGGWADGNAWIGVEVDKKFIEDTLVKERKIDKNSIPLTPIYDLVVKIIPDFNLHCISGYPEKAVTYNDLPETVEVRGSIQVDGEKFLSGGVFTKTPDTDLGPEGYTYQWKIKGWPNGIVSRSKIERLILAIASVSKKDDPAFVAESIDLEGKIVKEESSPIFNLCAPIYGAGADLVFLRGLNSSLEPKDLFSKVESVRQEGFEKIDPFKMYKDEFAYLIDLQTNNPVLSSNDEEVNASFLFAKLNNCGGGYLTYAYVGNLLNFRNAPLLGIANPSQDSILLKDKTTAALVMHETGHVVGGLSDESSKSFSGSSEFIYLDSESIKDLIANNCTLNPTQDFSYNGKLYGETNLTGCNYAKGILDDNDNILYPHKPSELSIMNNPSRSDRFNVVSCGHIVSDLDGGDPKANFEKCMAMDTIKPSSESSQSLVSTNSNKSLVNSNGAQNDDSSGTQEMLDKLRSIPTKGRCYVNLNLSNANKDFKVTSASYTTVNNGQVMPSLPSDLHYTIETYKKGSNEPYGNYRVPTKIDGGVYADNFETRESFYIPGYDSLIQVTIPSDGNLSRINVRRGDDSKTIYTNKKMLNCGVRTPRNSFFEIFNFI